MALTDDEKSSFEENGYLLKKNLVPEDWVSELQKETENIHRRMEADPPEGVGISWEDFGEDHPKFIKQLMHSEVVFPTSNKLLRSEFMLDIIHDLLGQDISLYHCKLLPKCAGDGTNIPWHQDYAYWKQDDNEPWMINCQFAISAATLENGCLQFVPGSHQHGIFEHHSASDRNPIGNALEVDVDMSQAEAISYKAGDCSFHHGRTLHYTGQNQTDQPRKSISTHFFPRSA